MKTTILLLAAALAAFVPTSVRAADDLHVSYEEGKAAFVSGQLEIAREKLAYVASKAPDHLPTKAMLAQIEAALGPNNTILRKSYEKIILERVEFSEVTVNEALQAVRMLSLKATQNKVAPNVIVKSPEIGQRLISLNLAQVPLSEVLSYVAQLSGSRLTYDKTAVVIASPGDSSRVATPANVPTPTIPGVTIPPPSTPTKNQVLNRGNLLNDPFARRS